ncbi:MAG: hypothetical protein L0Z62_21465 [Gemmataceae bacterium]|nr:hypothetical protein [Gemmataceae bacterium]
MDYWLGIGGLGLALAGAVIVALADAWFSRAVLVYLDVVEANLANVVEVLRSGGGQLVITPINTRRDRGQNRARAVKLLGWGALVVGVGLQFAAFWFARGEFRR